MNSINRKISHALIGLAPNSLKLTLVEIGELPLYNQDEEANPPFAWRRFRDRINDDMHLQQFMQAFNDWVAANIKSRMSLVDTPPQ